MTATTINNADSNADNMTYQMCDFTVRGDFVARDKITTINIIMLPGAESTLVDSVPTILTQKGRLQLPRTPEQLRDLETLTNLGQHVVVDKSALFDAGVWLGVGNTLLLLTCANYVLPLITYGVSQLYQFEASVTNAGELIARIWSNAAEPYSVKSSKETVIWPGISKEHLWCFEQMDPTVSIRVGGLSNSIVSFDPELVQTVWRIRHFRETRRTQTYLIAIRKEA